MKPCLQSVILCVGFLFFFKKRSGPELWDSGGCDDPDPDLQADPGIPRVLWPLTNPEEVNRQVDVRRFSTITGPHLSNQMSLTIGDLSAASLSRLDAASSLHEHGETASEGERAAQETSEESSRVSALFTPAPLPVSGVQL